MPERLSVVIPTYNRASLLPRAIRSVIADTHVDLEVIVVDDGSEDDTEAVVSDIADRRVRYMRVRHGGVSSARNAGATSAEGRWLGFLDSDDEVLPGWADAMVDAVGRSGGVAVCGGEAVDPDGYSLWTWTPPAVIEPLPQQVAEMYLPGMFVVDRRAFLDAGGYVDQLAFGENTELALRLLFRDDLSVAVEPRVLVRRHLPVARADYSESRISSARYVIEYHPWLRRRLPPLWASYNALVGVDAARHQRWNQARHHFLLAATAQKSLEHLSRLALSVIPLVRSQVWPATDSASDSTYFPSP